MDLFSRFFDCISVNIYLNKYKKLEINNAKQIFLKIQFLKICKLVFPFTL